MCRTSDAQDPTEFRSEVLVSTKDSLTSLRISMFITSQSATQPMEPGLRFGLAWHPELLDPASVGEQAVSKISRTRHIQTAKMTVSSCNPTNETMSGEVKI